MKLLFVGDPHVEGTSIQDAQRLMDLVDEVSFKNSPTTVLIVGDLYHTHGTIDANVQLFWWDFFEKMSERGTECIVLKGNHDGPGENGSRACALRAHSSQRLVETVIDEPLAKKGVLFCPYTSAEQLVKWSATYQERWTSSRSYKTLICHQTFDGSTYENGFYAGDGLDPALITQPQIISGHIHSPQEFGKVWYPGAPRWRTAADANTDRSIWLLEFEDGVLVKRTPFDTSTVCKKIHLLEDTPDVEFLCRPCIGHEYRVVSRGPAEWLEKRAAFFTSWAKWRGINTDVRRAVVRESDGIGVAFGKWSDDFTPQHGTPKPVLKEMVKDRLGGSVVVR